MVKRALSLALRFALIGGCLYFLASGLDLEQTLASFRNLEFGRLLVVEGAVVLTMLAPAWRLVFLTRHRVRFSLSLQTVFLCLGLNNIFPAKLGELAKVSFLRQRAGIAMSEGMGIVFWERFFDLNAVLLFGVLIAYLLDKSLLLVPLAVIVGVFWAFLLLNSRFPAISRLVLRLIPLPRLKDFVAAILEHLQEHVSWRFFLLLGWYTLLVWLSYLAVALLFVQWAAGLELTAAQVAAVFVVSSIGLSLPSSPGGMGVYEAAVVLSLGWFGVTKETALAAGIGLHVLQILPTVLGTLIILATSGVDRHDLMRFKPRQT